MENETLKAFYIYSECFFLLNQSNVDKIRKVIKLTHDLSSDILHDCVNINEYK